MALSRKSKIWLTILAIPVVLILAAVIIAKSIFTSEKLKALVVPRVEEATHRTVSLNDISLAVFPALGVDMQGFVLSNRVGEGFTAAPFLSVDRVRVSVKLLPLLKGKVEVSSVTIDHPQILVEVNKENKTNYGDLTGSSGDATSAGTAGQGEAGGTSLVVSDLRVNNGSVDYVSYKDNSATRVRGLQMTMAIEGSGRQFVISGDATVDSLSYGTVTTPMLSGLRVTAVHREVYDMNADVLTMQQGDVAVQNIKLVLAGKVSDLRKKNMVLDLTLGSDNVNIADLFSLIPAEYMKQAEGVKGTGTAAVKILMTGLMTDSTSGDITGIISTSGASIQYPKLPKPISNITIQSSFARTTTKQEFRIETLTANFGDNPMALTMAVVNFTNPLLTLTAKGGLNLAEVGQFYPLEAGTQLGGRIGVNVAIAGPVKNPAALKASGSMEFSDVMAKTASTTKPVEHLNGTITFNNKTVESKKLAMNIGASDLALNFALQNYLSIMSEDKSAPRATATMALQSNHLFTADIMKEEAAAGTAPKPATPAPASGKGGAPAAKQSAGLPLPNVDMTVTAAIGTLTMQKFEFSNVRALMTISNGLMTLRTFTLNAFGGTITSKGTLNLQHPDRPLFDMALDITAVQANAMLTPFTSFGSRLNGKLTMNTTMKGALNDTLGLVPNTLDGAGKVHVADGTLKGYKVNQSLASALSLPDLETINFKDWSNAFTVQNGRVIIKDLKITALNSDYVVNGSQGLDGTLDYAMSLYLPPSTSSRIKVAGFAGEAVNAFKDPNGRLKLDFNVGGSTDDPKVQLNTEAARNRVEEMAKQKVADEAKKLQDQLKDKAGNALKNLFKGKK